MASSPPTGRLKTNALNISQKMIEMFVRTKHKIDKSHEFALVVVNNDVTWVGALAGVCVYTHTHTHMAGCPSLPEQAVCAQMAHSERICPAVCAHRCPSAKASRRFHWQRPRWGWASGLRPSFLGPRLGRF